jgi:hypothetical protein
MTPVIDSEVLLLFASQVYAMLQKVAMRSGFLQPTVQQASGLKLALLEIIPSKLERVNF